MTRTISPAVTAAIAAAILGIAAAQPATAALNSHVRITVNGSSLSGKITQAQIREGLRRQGRKVDERQVRHAAAVIVDRYEAKRRRRQPGIILIHFKRLNATICASWGDHKDYCAKHAKSKFVGLKKSFVN